MKKLLVILTACSVMCAFGSCGDKEEKSSSESSVSDTVDVSVSESESENNTEQASEENSIQLGTHEYIEDADATAFLGKWECSKLVSKEGEVTDLSGIPVYAVFQYDILEDGTVALPDSLMEISDPENPITYSWGLISESEIEISGSNGSVIVYTLEDGQLVNVSEAEGIYLDKVDEFQDFDFVAYYEELMSQQDSGYVLTPVETDANGNIIETGDPIPVE
ncbi:MAG: hypothetical protein NC177_00425 [Ruminococcus flavefaciens]|nr:hypothetical protein [Ruminococcus flavefaciens]